MNRNGKLTVTNNPIETWTGTRKVLQCLFGPSTIEYIHDSSASYKAINGSTGEGQSHKDNSAAMICFAITLIVITHLWASATAAVSRRQSTTDVHLAVSPNCGSLSGPPADVNNGLKPLTSYNTIVAFGVCMPLSRSSTLNAKHNSCRIRIHLEARSMGLPLCNLFCPLQTPMLGVGSRTVHYGLRIWLLRQMLRCRIGQ